MNGIFLAILFAATTPSFEATTLDGQTVVGSIAELTAERLTITADTGRVSIATAKLLTLLPKQKAKPVANASGVVVEMTDGAVVYGRQYVARDDKAQITLANGEVIKVSTSAVRTVLCGVSEGDSLREEWSRLTGMKADADLLIVRGGDALDYHKGVLHDVTEDAVRFDLDGDVLPIKRTKVFGFAYRHGETTELPPTICKITDAAGSQWPAKSIVLAEKLTWTTPAGLTVSQPLASIARIDFSEGKLAYLSDLKPESIAWTPYFGGREPSPAMKQFYAPRFDRGFDLQPLRLGGVEYRKGLAMRSRTEIVYRLPERFSRFSALVGIADAVRPSGKVRLVLRGDDKVLLESKFSGSNAPRPIDLDVTGVRRLTVLVDFGDGPNIGDHLLLCNARVSK